MEAFATRSPLKIVLAVMSVVFAGLVVVLVVARSRREVIVLPASPYPSPGARAEPMPEHPVGPVDPELIGAS